MIISGMWNITKKHTPRQLNCEGKVTVIRKSVKDILAYKKWGGDNVFQRSREKEDGSVIAFFSSMITPISTYVENWTVCAAANLHWVLMCKRINEDDVNKLLKESLSPRNCLKWQGQEAIGLNK